MKTSVALLLPSASAGQTRRSNDGFPDRAGQIGVFPKAVNGLFEFYAKKDSVGRVNEGVSPAVFY
jgi:hypothetical protein